MRHICVILGPNLNLLGKREADQYGNLSLDQIKELTEKKLSGKSIKLDWFHSNFEAEVVEKIHRCIDSKYDAIVINPGAFTHTSVAISDAMKSFKNPIAEVHMSHVTSREPFRRTRLTSLSASMIIEGLGHLAYYIGILSVIERLEDGISNNRS